MKRRSWWSRGTESHYKRFLIHTISLLRLCWKGDRGEGTEEGKGKGDWASAASVSGGEETNVTTCYPGLAWECWDKRLRCLKFFQIQLPSWSVPSVKTWPNTSTLNLGPERPSKAHEAAVGMGPVMSADRHFLAALCREPGLPRWLSAR